MCGCRSSSPASRATSAPPSRRRSRARATPCAASPARPSAWRPPAWSSTTLVTGDALTGAGLERGDGRHRRRLLPDPLDGGRGGRRVPRAGAPRRASASPPPRRRPGCGGSSTSAGSCRARARPRAISPRGWRSRRRCWRGSPGVDRAARLDRDRRPLALVPLPRAADRAAARAGAARLARATARGRSTAATCSPTSSRRADAPAALSGRSWDIAGPDTVTYEELIDRIADVDARRPARSSGSASR